MDIILPETIVEKNFAIHLCEQINWSGEWPSIRPPDRIDIFTDGSKILNFSGAGIFCEQLSWEISINLGAHVTVFQAELHALFQSVKNCNNNDIVGKMICFFTDNKSILQSLLRSKTNSKSLQVCFSELNILGRNNDVHLFWIPAHQGIYGNEKADACAKIAASYPPIGPEPFLPLSSTTTRELLQKWVFQEHKKIWNSTESCRHTKLLIVQPLTGSCKTIMGLSRHKLRALIGVITGHYPVSNHLFTMGLSSTRLCRFCENDAESTYHLLCLCPNFTRSRQRAFGLEYLNSTQYSNIKVKDILCFINMESIIFSNF